MLRYISKIDHDMHTFLKVDQNKAEELWQKIKDRNFILEHSIEPASGNLGSKNLFAPSICHMILSHPEDVDPNFYNNFASLILRDTSLNRLTVHNNVTLLSVLLMNGFDKLNNQQQRTMYSAVKGKAINMPYIQKVVHYSNEDIIYGLDNGIAAVFRDEYLNISLSKLEVQKYLKRDYMTISEEVNFSEIDLLNNFVQLNPELDLNLKKTILELYKDSLDYRIDNDQIYGIDEETPKL